MTLTIEPGLAEGTVEAPPSKSMTHRALIVSAMSGDGVVGNPLLSDDTEATRAALEAMGASIDGEDLLRVTGELAPPSKPLDCRNAGTAIRLLSGVAATLTGETELTGDASLRQRPMGPLVEALTDLGAVADADDGTPPVTVMGPLVGGTCRVPGSVSSQFVSALVLAGLGAREPVRIAVDGELVSAPYVEMTVEMVRQAGGDIGETTTGLEVAPSDLEAVRYHVEGDWSSAAFPLALGALSGPVTVTGVDLDTVQGDVAVLDCLESLGAGVDRSESGVTVDGGELHGAEIDLGDTPDLFPVLAAVAAHADGVTRLTGAAHLREKESDRIEAMVTGLRALGGEAEPLDDGAEIHGGGLTGGKAKTLGDHRILMALAVAASAADGAVTLSESQSFTVSYPGFLDDLEALGVRWST